MKNILYIFICCLLCISCEDFLESRSLTNYDDSTFPRKEQDAIDMLTSVYAVWTQFDHTNSPWVLNELRSDDRLGGGGSGDKVTKAIATLKMDSDDMMSIAWKNLYTGISRCNALINNIDNISFQTSGLKDRILGEVYFNRASFYFELVRYFGNIPLILRTEDSKNAQASPEKIYEQIFKDYKNAIELLPNISRNKMSPEDRGHATIWAAKGMMARAFLFYTGYYHKTEIELTDGEKITKDIVRNHLIDCIENSGHDLLPKFGNLWPYSICQDYPYTVKNGLTYVGEKNENIEDVWSIRCSPLAGALGQRIYNILPLAFSFRDQNYQKTFPFGQGWGMGTVNSTLMQRWEDEMGTNDIRRKASILDPTDPEEGIANYNPSGRNNDQMEATGFWQKKYTSINLWTNAEKTKFATYTSVIYGQPNDFRWKHAQNIYVLRFSDILLMAAELECPNAQEYFNRVRQRVGLDAIPVSIENIQKERHYEFFGEGIRYYDLMRWGIAGETLLKNLNGIDIINAGVETNYNCSDIRDRYNETSGFLPIPMTEIRLSNGVLKQNPGWTGENCYYRK